MLAPDEDIQNNQLEYVYIYIYIHDFLQIKILNDCVKTSIISISALNIIMISIFIFLAHIRSDHNVTSRHRNHITIEVIRY